MRGAFYRSRSAHTAARQGPVGETRRLTTRWAGTRVSFVLIVNSRAAAKALRQDEGTRAAS